jgi:hypothetical protein
MPTITIKPACLRDLSYTAAYMRPEDEQEILCQLPDDTPLYEACYGLLQAGDAYIAYYDGVPAMAFGTHPLNVCTLNAWAFGTDKLNRVLYRATQFLIGVHLPMEVAKGFTHMEARTSVEHKGAHRWLESTGAVVKSEPFVYGKNGEEFILYRWSSDMLQMATERYRVKPQ